MSHYTYTDTDGDALTLEAGAALHRITLTAKGEFDTKAIYIANEDAPTVALELLKAAGQESVIVPKSDLPAVAQDHGGDPHSFHAGGVSIVFTSAKNAREWVLRDIAVWQHLEAREAAEKAAAEAAEKKLQERRDALARGFSPYLSGYGKVSPTARKAIDRIIELEDGASRD